jgi:signal transduction histidine kinase/CheY-like chemotaxis protein/HPt (histidine-containing phosphotransfer) domain-containing protein
LQGERASSLKNPAMPSILHLRPPGLPASWHAGVAILTLSVLIPLGYADQLAQPLISTFSAAKVSDNAMLWTMTQARDGVLYFGSDSLITFDGDHWNSFPPLGGYALRGLDFSPDGTRLWAGGTNTIGWFDRDLDGAWHYHSLVSFLPQRLQHFGDCWRVFAQNDGAVFVTQDRVLRWDGKSMRSWSLPGKVRLGAMRMDGAIYVHDLATGLYRLDADSLSLVIPAASLGKGVILWMGQIGSDWLLATSDGFFKWDGNMLHPFAGEASALMRSKFLTAVAPLSGGRLAVGTLSGGIAIVAPDGGLDQVLTVASAGLPTNQIFTLNLDQEGGLWVTSSSQIFRINLTPSLRLIPRLGVPAYDPVTSVAVSGKDIYAATATAIYPIAPHPLALLSGRIPFAHDSIFRTMLSVPEGVLVAHLWGVDLLANGVSSPVWLVASKEVFSIASSHAPGHVFVGTLRAVYDLSYRTGLARLVCDSLPDIPALLAEDSQGRIWVGTDSAGALLVLSTLSAAQTYVPASTIFAGLPDAGSAIVAGNASGDVYVFSGQDAWFFSSADASVYQVSDWPKRAVIAASGVGPDGSVWVIHKADATQGPCLASISLMGQRPFWHPHTVDGLWAVGLPESIAVQTHPAPAAPTLLIAGTDGILKTDVDPLAPAEVPLAPLVRVFAQGSAGGAFHAISGPLPFSVKNIMLQAAVPTFARRPAIRPQAFIEGIDPVWTTLNSSSERELSGLADGIYTVHVRDMADTGLVSPATTIRFVIEPPWWRTAAAKTLAVFTLVAVGYSLQLFRTRALRRRARELEETVQKRTEQANRANAAKSEFVARISHNIRNPLNAIVGLTVALDDNPKPERQREILAALHTCTEHLSTLIDDVLDFSRIEAGKVALNPSSCSPRGLLDGLSASLAAQAAAAGAEIEIELDPALPAYLLVDVHRIEEILLNFLTNAIRYAPGRILLKAGVNDGSEKVAEFSVTDHGAGFSGDEQEMLFINYAQVNSTSRVIPGGTGLGLALCKRLADLMGGSVGVESTKGRGARFYVRLPLVSAEAPTVTGPLRFQIPRALIVEDADYNAWAFSAVLSRLGVAACDRASNGREALDLFGAHVYDLVLLDRSLPDMDGIEVAKQMRKTGEIIKHPLVVCVSAYSTTEDRELCLASGMDYFAGKPLSPEKLSNILREAGVGFLPVAPVPAPNPSGTSSKLDTSLLMYLATNGAASISDQMDRYIATLKDYFQGLTKAIASGDHAAIGREAHALSGHAKFINASELASVVTEIENTARFRSPAALAPLADKLKLAVDDVVSELLRTKPPAA